MRRLAAVLGFASLGLMVGGLVEVGCLVLVVALALDLLASRPGAA